MANTDYTHHAMSTFIDPQGNWNRRYADKHYVFGETPNAYLQSQVTHLVPGTALSVADGEGRNGVWLAEQGLNVDTFDFSDNAIQKAHALAKKRKTQINCVCSDWQSFNWKREHYNNVVGIFFQFATPEERTLLFARMIESLKPGGTLIIQGYTPRQLDFNTGGPGKLAHLYDEALMLEAFGPMEILDLRSYEAEISEGTGHLGMSGLLGLTARKPVRTD